MATATHEPPNQLRSPSTSGHGGFLVGDPPRRLRTGQRVGRYELLQELGRGGFSIVFKARDLELERTVALKILDPGSWQERDFQERFRDEAHAAARIISPHLVILFESGTFANTAYLAFEYVHGGDLKVRVREQGPLALENACSIICQCVSGLAELDSAGLVHRDIKPANIFIDQLGNAKLGDLGLAKRVQDLTDVTQQLTDEGVLGTPCYMSPEHLSGKVDIRSDIYSLGASFYELLAGRPPFVDKNPMMVVQNVLCDEPPPITDFAPHVPDSVVHIIETMMHKQPELRYQTPTELLDELRRVTGQTGAHRSTITLDSIMRSAPIQSSRWQRRALGVMAAVVVAAIAIFALTANRSDEGELMLVEDNRGDFSETALERPPPSQLPQRSLSDAPTPERNDETEAPTTPERADVPEEETMLAGSPLPRMGDPRLLLPAPREEQSAGSADGAATPGIGRRLQAVPAALPISNEDLTIDGGRDAIGPWIILSVDGISQRFRPVPAGSFIMGAKNSRDSGAPVTISEPYWMAETECPQALYEQVTGDNPSSFVGPALPVEQIDWYDAQRFTRQLSSLMPGLKVRLPTEAEWEWAARQGASGSMPGHRFLDSSRTMKTGTRAVSVGNPDRLGLVDLMGNVGEWCLDGYHPLPVRPRVDPVAEPAAFHVTRGGNWFDAVQDISITTRRSQAASLGNSRIGFRILIPADIEIFDSERASP